MKDKKPLMWKTHNGFFLKLLLISKNGILYKNNIIRINGGVHILLKRKLIVSFISITISLICLPFILGLELSPYELEQEGILYFF
jgi:hypothetical protein